MKRSLTDLYESLDDVTESLSSQVRALALGVLALVWLFLSGGDDVPKSVAAHGAQLKLIAVCCVVALLADLLQYVFGYFNTLSVVRGAEKAKQEEASFNRKSFAYQARHCAFYVKIFLAVVAAVWIVFLIGSTLG